MRSPPRTPTLSAVSTKVVEADARLDAVLAQAQEANRQAERARARLDQDLTARSPRCRRPPTSSPPRRGAVGAEARPRLSEAQRHLEAAQQLAESDPSKALQHAQSATQLASRALWAAQADVNRYQDNQRPPSGGVTGSGGNAAGAILGGILIDSMLRGGFGRGRQLGRTGGGGWGGPGPGSFGGRAARTASPGRRRPLLDPKPPAPETPNVNMRPVELNACDIRSGKLGADQALGEVALTWSRETRSCAMVSRSRIVTAWSSRVSKSTVMQNGVPISSWRR